MREDLRSELDLLFKKGNKVGWERRADPQLKDFETHLKDFQTYVSLRDRVIRPVMEQFGKYLESLGHRYFIETAEELVEGHRYPTSRIALHIVLNGNLTTVPQTSPYLATAAPTYPSFSFMIDHTGSVYAVKKANQSILPVNQYACEGFTSDLVEENIKQFLLEIAS